MPRRHQSHAPETRGSEAALPWAALPDAALVARLRTPATSSRPSGLGSADPRACRKQIAAAAAELRRRRLPAVLDYAGLFAAEASVQALTREALQHAVRDIRTAPDVDHPPPHHPLLLVERTAGLWAGTTRRKELSADFVAWLDRTTHTLPRRPSTAPPSRECDSIVRAYQELPRRTQGALWHSVVQRDGAHAAGRSLGVHPDRVPHLRRSALEDIRLAYLHLDSEPAAKGHCRCFSSLLEAATRRRGAYPSDALDRHTAVCFGCSRARSVLNGMNERPGEVMAAALLPWGGAAFAAARRRRTTNALPAPRAGRMPGTRGRAQPRTERAPGLPWLRHVARKCPAVTVTAAAGILAAAATTVHLPVNGHTTGAADPVPRDSARTSPHPAAPTPARGPAPDRSDGTGTGSRPSDDTDRGEAEVHVPGQTPARSHASTSWHSSSARPGLPASVHAHGQARAHPELAGIPSGLFHAGYPPARGGAQAMARTVADAPDRSLDPHGAVRRMAQTTEHLVLDVGFAYHVHLFGLGGRGHRGGCVGVGDAAMPAPGQQPHAPAVQSFGAPTSCNDEGNDAARSENPAARPVGANALTGTLPRIVGDAPL
ncbi:hypothetical protein [Streptomyces sp. NPDC020362]|uniref:hypothetical protein n=1 Tax=unclassified Streptomyces TaxID=2593676 RepID=UPI0033F1460E